MSRADDLRARTDAELAVVELEDELTRLKGLKRPDPDRLRTVKADLRAARQRFRELREGAPVEGGDGDAVATPATVAAAANVNGGES